MSICGARKIHLRILTTVVMALSPLQTWVPPRDSSYYFLISSSGHPLDLKQNGCQEIGSNIILQLHENECVCVKWCWIASEVIHCVSTTELCENRSPHYYFECECTNVLNNIWSNWAANQEIVRKTLKLENGKN